MFNSMFNRKYKQPRELRYKDKKCDQSCLKKYTTHLIFVGSQFSLYDKVMCGDGEI